MKEIFEFACNIEGISFVFLDEPENKQTQNAIVKAIDDCRRTIFNVNSALHIRLVAKNKYFQVLRKILELIKLCYLLR